MDGLDVGSNLLALREILVLLVPLDDSMTLTEFERICEKAEPAKTKIFESHTRPSQNFTCSAQALHECVAANALRAGFALKHYAWDHTSIRYRILRSFNLDKNRTNWTSDDAHQKIRGSIGLKSHGFATSADEHRTREAAVDRGADATYCAVRVVVVDAGHSIKNAVALLLDDICQSVRNEVSAKAEDLQLRQPYPVSSGAPGQSTPFRFIASRTAGQGKSSSKSQGRAIFASGRIPEISASFARSVRSQGCSCTETPIPAAGVCAEMNAQTGSHARNLTATATRSVDLFRRNLQSTDIKARRAQELKELADLALLVSDVQDALHKVAIVTTDLKATSDPRRFAGLLITWAVVTLSAADRHTLVHALTNAPVTMAAGVSFTRESFLKQRVTESPLATTDSFSNRSASSRNVHEFRTALLRLPDDALVKFAHYHVSKVSLEAARIVQPNSPDPHMVVDFALKAANWNLSLQNKMAVASALRILISAVGGGTVGAFNTIRALQAAAVLFTRATLSRKAALYATIASNECSELRNWTGAILCSLGVVRTCLDKSGWIKVCMLALNRCVEAAMRYCDIPLLASCILRRARQHMLIVEAQGASSQTGLPTLSSLSDNIRQVTSSTYKSTQEQQLSILDELETNSIDIPTDVWVRQAREHQQPPLSIASMALKTCNFDIKNVQRNWTRGLKAVVQPVKRSVGEDTLLYNPFMDQTCVSTSARDSLSCAIWAVGERATATLEIRNSFHIPVYIKAAQFVCSGSRCLCHDFSNLPECCWRIGASRETATTIKLDVTPLEPGPIVISGVHLQTSTYLTKNQSYLKFAYHAVASIYAAADASSTRRIRHACTGGISAIQSPPRIAASLVVLPFSSFDAKSCPHPKTDNIECALRPGERISVAVVIMTEVIVSPTPIQLHSRSVEDSLSQTLLDVDGSFYREGPELSALSGPIPAKDPIADADSIGRSAEMHFRTEPSYPSAVILEMREAARRVGTCEILLSQSISKNFVRETAFRLKLNRALGICVDRVSTSKEKTRITARIQITNKSASTALVGRENQCCIIRAGEPAATLLLSLPYDSCPNHLTGDHCAHLRGLEWRVTGSHDGENDGSGYLALRPG